MLENLTIAHRGIFNNEDIPENSISAFKLAVSKNIPIEFDIQITKDDKLVIFHDDNLYRMTGINKNIQEVNYDEIKDLYLLNTKQKIPTLTEVLNLVNGKVLLDIEIKHTKKIGKIVDLVLKELENYNGKVLLKSFDPMIVKRIRKRTNKYKLGLLLTDKYDNKALTLLFKTKIPLIYSKPDFIAINKKLLNTNFYKKAKDKYFIFLWTIKSDKEKEKYNKKYLKLNYICNNLNKKEK